MLLSVARSVSVLRKILASYYTHTLDKELPQMAKHPLILLSLFTYFPFWFVPVIVFTPWTDSELTFRCWRPLKATLQTLTRCYGFYHLCLQPFSPARPVLHPFCDVVKRNF